MSDTKHITDLPEVFALFGSNVKLADVLNVGPSTVSEMKRRKSIPVEYWPALVLAATEMGDNDLTLEKLAMISAEAAIERAKEREQAA